jgi:hypothetical protein
MLNLFKCALIIMIMWCTSHHIIYTCKYTSTYTILNTISLTSFFILTFIFYHPILFSIAYQICIIFPTNHKYPFWSGVVRLPTRSDPFMSQSLFTAQLSALFSSSLNISSYYATLIVLHLSFHPSLHSIYFIKW